VSEVSYNIAPSCEILFVLNVLVWTWRQHVSAFADRVTRLGEFSPLGRLFSSADFEN
jgi:hypothetical protein